MSKKVAATAVERARRAVPSGVQISRGRSRAMQCREVTSDGAIVKEMTPSSRDTSLSVGASGTRAE